MRSGDSKASMGKNLGVPSVSNPLKRHSAFVFFGGRGIEMSLSIEFREKAQGLAELISHS